MLSQRLDGIEQKLDDQSEQILTKVDCDIFDEQMKNLKNLIAALNSDDKSQISQIIQ